jgi:CRISPR type I-F-associated protein Csy2
MSSIFLVINNINVTQAQAMGNLYTTGFPSLTGVLGTMHAWQRKVHEKFSKGIKFIATSIYIRELESSHSHAKYTPAHEDQRASSNQTIAATIDARTINFCIDLIIPIDLDINLDKEINFLESKFFREIILSNFFCGGFIESIGSIKCEENFLNSLKSIPASAFVIECAQRDLINVKEKYQIDSLEALLRMCERGNSLNRIEEINFYAIPLAVGFASLEDQPQKREGARNENHIFAEPILGAGRLRTVGSLRKNEKEEKTHNIFWTHFSNTKFFTIKALSTLEI